MWIYTSEQSSKEIVRHIIKLDSFNQVSVIHERGEWKVVASLESPTNSEGRVFLARTISQKEAIGVQDRIFQALTSGQTTIDLNAPGKDLE
jgi:hypothetical protein